MDTQVDDDLDYYSLPAVDPAEYYELGQCIRNKKPYDGEPEKMVIEVRPMGGNYLLQAIMPDGTLGWKEWMGMKDAHYYYEKV